ncbi:hypothetical protein D3C77_348100 [compost metagenome]
MQAEVAGHVVGQQALETQTSVVAVIAVAVVVGAQRPLQFLGSFVVLQGTFVLVVQVRQLRLHLSQARVQRLELGCDLVVVAVWGLLHLEQQLFNRLRLQALGDVLTNTQVVRVLLAGKIGQLLMMPVGPILGGDNVCVQLCVFACQWVHAGSRSSQGQALVAIGLQGGNQGQAFALQFFVAGLHAAQHQFVVEIGLKIHALGQCVIQPAVQVVVAILVGAVVAFAQVVVDRVGAVCQQLVDTLLADLGIAGDLFAVGLLRGQQLLAQFAPGGFQFKLVFHLVVDAGDARAQRLLVGQRGGDIRFDPGQFGAQLGFGISARLQLQEGILVEGRSMFELEGGNVAQAREDILFQACFLITQGRQLLLGVT